MAEEKTKRKSEKRDRSRNKKVIIVGPSVTVNGKIYGASAMQTTYESSMPVPDKERVQAICAEAYMKLLALFNRTEKESSFNLEFPVFTTPKKIVPETIPKKAV